MSEGSSVTLIFSKCRKELSFFGFFFFQSRISHLGHIALQAKIKLVLGM